MANTYPIVRHLRVGEQTGPAALNGLVNVDLHLSQVNRRLYRQGRVYRCKVDLQSGLADNTQYTVYALADTWMLRKAWKAAFDNYMEQTSEERATYKGQLARWNDFKLNTSQAFTSASTLSVGLVQPDGTEVPLTDGEYLPSRVEDDAGTARFYGIANSAGGTTFDILGEFDKLGGVNSSPTVTQTAAAYGDVDSDLTTTEIGDVTNRGNLPPYAQNDSHPANPWRKIGVLHSDTGGQRLTTGYFDAPLGLVAIVSASGHKLFSQGTELTVEVKAGDYKGVHATSLLE
jgi:hypothetical protein